MDTDEIAPGLHRLRLGIANAYLITTAGGAALVDTGPPGSAPAVAAALDKLGLRQEELHTIVLTHHHDDHAGSAAEISSWAGATVLAGRDDAAVVAHDEPAPEPRYTPSERALHEVIMAAGLAPAPPCPVHRAVAEGDVLAGAGGAVVVETPGHTPGSIALHLPDLGALLTGDTVGEQAGQTVLGPFNVDRELAWRSLQRLAGFDVAVAGFGHGEPVTNGAARAIGAAIDRFAD